MADRDIMGTITLCVLGSFPVLMLLAGAYGKFIYPKILVKQKIENFIESQPNYADSIKNMYSALDHNPATGEVRTPETVRYILQDWKKHINGPLAVGHNNEYAKERILYWEDVIKQEEQFQHKKDSVDILIKTFVGAIQAADNVKLSQRYLRKQGIIK